MSLLATSNDQKPLTADIRDDDDDMESRDLNISTIYNQIPFPVEEAVVEDDKGAWRRKLGEVSLPEVHGTILIPTGDDVSCLRKFASFLGPGVMVAVGYMDPGNWSTDIAGGSAFGYSLLFVVLLSSLIAMFLQALTAKLGIATKRDLAQVCRDIYPQPVVYVLWIVAEVAIMATDVAEVIGSAIALKLLFGVPLIAGVFVTIVDVFLLLLLQGRSFRYTEAIVAVLILLITVCFAVNLALSKPNAQDLFSGYLPDSTLLTNNHKLFIAIGIVGATVMPHNLYLHSSIVLTRDIKYDDTRVLNQYIKYAQFDSTLSLCGALFVNSSILILAAATFYRNGFNEVATLEEAYKLLAPLLGSRAGQALFGIALLASGLNATLTGTIAGQIVMEGFTTWTINPIYRRLITRTFAILPALLAITIGGDAYVNDLLIISQVLLSFALPFAVFPLVHVTGSKALMGEFVNHPVVRILAYAMALFLVTMNIILFI